MADRKPPHDSNRSHPERVGPYRILQMLGEGGMGIVYEAEQREPVHRRIALKVIKLGLDTRQVVARFDAERQALAVMDHPCIAKVFDAGATEEGRPYFAMELVRGVPITEYCDAQRLGTRDRLLLFIELCRAMQHAHQKGVIHRDLKPSNILATEEQGRVMPKVIDFGVAKAMGTELTEETLVTELGRPLGTAAYMSPEQAEMSGMDIDTRSDIYSLGVLLYEMLVGSLPLDPGAMSIHAFFALLSAGETRSPTPSSKLQSLGDDGHIVATRRRTDERSLRRQLKGDLDWIVMKALDPDRTRRYETASGLALDIQRHLDREPVRARAPTLRYRASRFIARHKAGVTSIAALLVVTTAFAVTMMVQRDRARAAEELARQEAAKASAINDFLQGMLGSADPWRSGREVRVAEVLADATRDVGGTFDDQPVVEAEVRMTLGRTYRNLGLLDEAEPHLRRAVHVNETGSAATDSDVAASLNALGELLRDKGEYAASDSLHRRALELQRGSLGEAHPDIATTLTNLARARHQQGDYQEAERLHRDALEMRRRLLGDDHREVSSSLNRLATVLFAQGDYEGAEPLFREALQVLTRSVGEEHPDVTESANNLAMTLQRLERYDEAEPLLVEALETNREIFGDEHPRVAQGLNNLAMFHYRRGDLGDAEPLFHESLEMNRRLYGEEHPEVATILNNLALLYDRRGDVARAEDYFRQVIAMDRELRGENHPYVASGLKSLAAVLVSSERYADAEELFREALEIQRRTFPEDHWEIATTRSLLGGCLTRAGRYGEAEPLVLESFELIRGEFGDEHGRTQAALNRLIELYEAWGDEESAARYREIRASTAGA